MKYDINSYKLTYDHHTHTVYSHGKGTVEQNVAAAEAAGLRSVAITDHGPGHLNYGLKLSELEQLYNDVEAARKAHPNVEVLLGVELNIVRKQPHADMTPEKIADLQCFDILLGGYHYGILGAGMISNWLWQLGHKGGLKYKEFDGEWQAEMSGLLVKNTQMTVNAVEYFAETGRKLDILTHPGDKGPFDIYDISAACQKTGTLLEINGKHPHLSVEELRVAKSFDVKFVISSDAHDPSQVGRFESQLVRAFEAGIEPERIVNLEKK